jgi:hypothetical protein
VIDQGSVLLDADTQVRGVETANNGEGLPGRSVIGRDGALSRRIGRTSVRYLRLVDEAPLLVRTSVARPNDDGSARGQLGAIDIHALSADAFDFLCGRARPTLIGCARAGREDQDVTIPSLGLRGAQASFSNAKLCRAAPGEALRWNVGALGDLNRIISHLDAHTSSAATLKAESPIKRGIRH